MNDGIITWLLGVLGTVIGTVLGWFLNSLSQKGKLKIHLINWEEKYSFNKMGIVTPCNNLNEATYFSYKTTLDVYNSSRENRIMREICILFLKQKKGLFVSIPKDDRTRKDVAPISVFDDVSVINVPAKSVLRIKLHDALDNRNENWVFLREAERIKLEYTNERGRKKQILLRKRILQH